MAPPTPFQIGRYRNRPSGADTRGGTRYSAQRVEPTTDIQPADLVEDTPRVNAVYGPRKLWDILADLQALTSAQKANIAADLFGGSPPKWSQDAGPGGDALLVGYLTTQLATLSAADKNLAKLYAAALYVRDNPGYLVAPAFDPTITVYGDQPAA